MRTRGVPACLHSISIFSGCGVARRGAAWRYVRCAATDCVFDTPPLNPRRNYVAGFGLRASARPLVDRFEFRLFNSNFEPSRCVPHLAPTHTVLVCILVIMVTATALRSWPWLCTHTYSYLYSYIYSYTCSLLVEYRRPLLLV